MRLYFANAADVAGNGTPDPGHRQSVDSGFERRQRGRLFGRSTALMIVGLGLFLAGIGNLWFFPPTVDVGTVEIARKGASTGPGVGHPAGSAGAETLDDLLTRCYGSPPPATPRREAGRQTSAFEQGKQAVRAGMERAVDLTTRPLSPEEEQVFGRRLATEMHRNHPASDDRALQDRVSRIVQRLRKILPGQGRWDYHFEVLESRRGNAFMGPGGTGFFFRPLGSLMGSDDALALVLAHEIAHSELRHLDPLLRTAKAGREIGRRILGSDEGGDLGETAATISTSLMRLTYDQDQEYEADRLGLCLAVLAGFSSGAGIEAMDGLAGRDRDRPPQDETGRILYDVVSSHPPLSERVAYFRTLERVLRGTKR
ncbi:MAG TPA: M48 family metalloprotease [Myxococcota bacterium]|nr:M48 family metalloprotease [Myxococcota bacterium]HQK50443.1 M48 family metalloprotease [Myxococcota bacterium]